MVESPPPPVVDPMLNVALAPSKVMISVACREDVVEKDQCNSGERLKMTFQWRKWDCRLLAVASMSAPRRLPASAFRLGDRTDSR